MDDTIYYKCLDNDVEFQVSKGVVYTKEDKECLHGIQSEFYDEIIVNCMVVSFRDLNFALNKAGWCIKKL